MERSSFFNSINGDRKYQARDFAAFFNSFITNGVFPNPSTNLQVIANNNMTVAVKVGKAWINGYNYINDSDLILPITVADGVLNRIDRVVLRMDIVLRKIYAYVKKGQFASSPVAPSLQRDADAFELGIADIRINKGAIATTQADITDLRLNKELCGIVHGAVDQIDVTTLFNQYTEGFKLKEDEFKVSFLEWFASIKNLLNENVAGNLSNQILDLKSLVNGKASSVELSDYKKLTDIQLSDITKKLSYYNDFGITKDSRRTWTERQWKRPDGKLYLKSTLSNSDASGNYRNMVWNVYKNDGVTIDFTVTWTLTYDIDSDLKDKTYVIN